MVEFFLVSILGPLNLYRRKGNTKSLLCINLIRFNINFFKHFNIFTSSPVIIRENNIEIVSEKRLISTSTNQNAFKRFLIEWVEYIYVQWITWDLKVLISPHRSVVGRSADRLIGAGIPLENALPNIGCVNSNGAPQSDWVNCFTW